MTNLADKRSDLVLSVLSCHGSREDHYKVDCIILSTVKKNPYTTSGQNIFDIVGISLMKSTFKDQLYKVNTDVSQQ